MQNTGQENHYTPEFKDIGNLEDLRKSLDMVSNFSDKLVEYTKNMKNNYGQLRRHNFELGDFISVYNPEHMVFGAMNAPVIFGRYEGIIPGAHEKHDGILGGAVEFTEGYFPSVQIGNAVYIDPEQKEFHLNSGKISLAHYIDFEKGENHIKFSLKAKGRTLDEYKRMFEKDDMMFRPVT